MVNYTNGILEKIDQHFRNCTSQLRETWPPTLPYRKLKSWQGLPENESFPCTYRNGERHYNLRVEDINISRLNTFIDAYNRKKIQLGDEFITTAGDIQLLFKFRDEVLYNLSSFQRDGQEGHYYKILALFLEEVENINEEWQEPYQLCLDAIDKVSLIDSPKRDTCLSFLKEVDFFIAEIFQMIDGVFQILYPLLKPSLVATLLDISPTGDIRVKIPMPDINSSQLLVSEPTTEQGVKLKWNGTNRVLYDLFAQLTLMDVSPGKRMIGNTIKDLARFLSDNVEGFPKAETIERELEKMREPQGIEKAKRGRIDLNINRDKG